MSAAAMESTIAKNACLFDHRRVSVARSPGSTPLTFFEILWIDDVSTVHA